MDDLKRALAEGELTVYVGAGASLPSGRPSCDRLVLTTYLAALGELEPADNPLRGWCVSRSAVSQSHDPGG